MPYVLKNVRIEDVDAKDSSWSSSDDRLQNDETNGFFRVVLSAHPNATLMLASHRGLRVTTTTYTAHSPSIGSYTASFVETPNVDVGPTSGRSSSSARDGTYQKSKS